MNQTMRLAGALKRSPETLIGKSDLPSAGEQYRLTELRNAIDHNVDPIVDGEAGIGRALALEVGETDLSINRGGQPVVVTQAELGGWVGTLHALAVDLIQHPDRWVRA